jgi:hypothetical protein
MVAGMSVSAGQRFSAPGLPRPEGSPVRNLVELNRIAELATPVTLAREHTLPVMDPFTELMPRVGLRRGSTVIVEGPGSTTLAVALAVQSSVSGSWVAAVGMPELGQSAASELGAALQRWAFVDHPGDRACEVVAALVGSVDLVLVGPHVRMGRAHTRRIAARMRERGTTVIQVCPDSRETLSADVHLRVDTSKWVGLQDGHGRLEARLVEVSTVGKGAAARRRKVQLWLPGPDGRVSSNSAGSDSAEVIELFSRAG